MSFPAGAIWNCRSGFGICFKHTTMFRGTARGRRRGRYLIVSCNSLGEWSTLPGGRFFPRTAGANTSPSELHDTRSEEHTSELQSPYDLVCRLLLEKKKKKTQQRN